MAGLMGASTFALIIASVLAADLIAEFALARWQVGLLATASAVSGALLAPVLGSRIDMIGAKLGTIISFTVSGLVLGIMAVAPVYAVLFFAAVLSGVPQAMSNPATNKLISLHVEPGSRGVITGIKQSGVQVGVFFGGLTLPIIAAASGWRIAVAVYLGLALIGAAVSAWKLPADPPNEHPEHGRTQGPIPSFIRRLSAYGFLLGAGGAAIFQWVPLFAKEELGMSPQLAGLAAAVMGFAGIVGRIWWGRAAERSVGVHRSLLLIAGGSMIVTVCLALAPPNNGWLLWPAVVIAGFSVSSWNSVGMLAVIEAVPAQLAGRASGVVMFGFLFGLGIGSLCPGCDIDAASQSTNLKNPIG